MAKYIIIPRGSEMPYKRIILEWHKGLDATVIENGDFILGEDCKQLLAGKYSNRTVAINDKEVNIIDSMKDYPVVDERDIIFKQPASEQEIIKTK